MDAEDGRTEIPLRMIDGNLDVLLSGEFLECNGVRLIHDPQSPHGVLMLFSFSEEQKQAAHARGFQTRNLSFKEGE